MTSANRRKYLDSREALTLQLPLREISSVIAVCVALSGCAAEPSNSSNLSTLQPSSSLEAARVTAPSASSNGSSNSPSATGPPGSGAIERLSVDERDLAVESSPEDPSLVSVIAKHGGRVRSSSAELGIVRVTFDVADQAELIEIRDELRDLGFSATLIAEIDHGETDSGSSE